MVTQAEYGAEIEAETTEKDPSELQYITPIDYAKRIAELDEDLRDAAEILVTDCSCYTPFRACGGKNPSWRKHPVGTLRWCRKVL